MKKLLITLLLVSPFSFADWGDVYYCQMTTHSGTTVEGKRTDYQLEKFTFKLDKTKNAMVFSKNSNMFKNLTLGLKENYLPNEIWYADSDYSKVYFKNGKFLFVRNSFDGSASISADCDKF